VTLAILANAFLVVAALTQHTRHPQSPEHVPVTCNEVGHLFAVLAHRLRWSAWRRRHKPAPAPATTADRPPGNHEARDPRLDDRQTRGVIRRQRVFTT
jgi:hypothetical protein